MARPSLYIYVQLNPRHVRIHNWQLYTHVLYLDGVFNTTCYVMDIAFYEGDWYIITRRIINAMFFLQIHVKLVAI